MSKGRVVLVDTGVGPADSPFAKNAGLDGRLLAGLRAVGIEPEDVDTVVFTHLHLDHVGWNVVMENGERTVTFPNAKYVIHQEDWDSVHSPEMERRPFVEECVDPLVEFDALELVSGEHTVTDEMTTLHTPGHTPGHMCLLVSSGNQKAVILGDVAAHPAQLMQPDVAFMYDADKTMARETRRWLSDRMEAEGMTIGASHFAEPGFGRIVRLDGRRLWQAL